MRPLTVALAALSVFGLPGQALAACPGETQAEMNRCADQAYREADARLNAAWPAARASAAAAGAGELLLDAQRKWLLFRDAACAAEAAPYEGGSLQPVVRLDCLRRLTDRRSADLRALSQ
ncbi:lysozyme inhibitor LprI family protein [Rhodovulum sp. MB263]|uniref:lysozyme inhibitor LprI family protein n=1 Tax=Rhodovulum sp. (strain MB263) TaxID=308754 RepID=UPI0018C887F7|nr:lysozyme inhibitor LprI family protein [Rhodovulum sp. MB263]